MEPPQSHLGMHTGNGYESLPIAKPNEVQIRIMKLQPRIKHWEKFKNDLIHPSHNYPATYTELGIDNCAADNECLDLSILENGDGYITSSLFVKDLENS